MSESITFDIVESKYPIKISIINQDVITKSESYLSVHLKPDEANFIISMFRFQLENNGFLCKSQNPTPDCIFKLQMRICEVARQNTNLEAENEVAETYHVHYKAKFEDCEAENKRLKAICLKMIGGDYEWQYEMALKEQDKKGGEE